MIGAPLLAAMLRLAPVPPSEPEPDDAQVEGTGDAGAPEAARRTIVVTGTRTATTLADAPVATSVVSRQEIVESGAQNVAEAI